MRRTLLGLTLLLPLAARADSPASMYDDYAYPSMERTKTRVLQVERAANPHDDAGMNGPEATAGANSPASLREGIVVQQVQRASNPYDDAGMNGPELVAAASQPPPAEDARRAGTTPEKKCDCS